MYTVSLFEGILLSILIIIFCIYLWTRVYSIWLYLSTKILSENISSRLKFGNIYLIYFRILSYLIVVFLILFSYFLPAPGKEEWESYPMEGVDIVFLVDTSLSMNSTDVNPTRLQKFKEVLLNVLPELYGNRVGIIAFAGSPFLYCPLTSDIHAFSDYVRGLDVDVIGDKGTEFSSLFKKAKDIIDSDRVLRNRLVVLVSDGEDHSSTAIPDMNSKVVVWGLGETWGSPIFYKDTETSTQGYVTKQGTISPYSSGTDIILSSSNLDFLREFARANKGEFHDLTHNAAGAWKILDTVRDMNQNSNDILKGMVQKKNSHLYLIPAVVILLLDILIVDLLLYYKRM